MLSTELEYLCTGLEFFLQGWNASYRFGMLPTGLECVRQSWNTFVQGWKTFVQGWNTFVQG
jgi:hypothetical protein